MKQGTGAAIPETWIRFASADDARLAAKSMYHDDRVLRVMLVADSTGAFIESIDR
jgi:hypothetical protein